MDHNAVNGGHSEPLTDTDSMSNTETAFPGKPKDSSWSPVLGGRKKKPSSTIRNRALVHDAVVNVVLSSRYIGAGNISPGLSRKFPGFESQVKAKMIISIWTLENQRYFTLTFTSASNAPLPSTRSHSRAVSRTPNPLSPTKSFPTSPTSPGFFCSCGSSPSMLGSSSGVPLSVSPFPPLGAPSNSDVAKAPSALEKIARMKDGMINAMEIPVFVMWKDESLMIPNAAAARLLYKKADPISEDGYGLMSRFKLYTTDFERELERDEMPLVRLCRTQKPFSKWKIGVIDSNLQRRHFDVSGEGIFDDKSGEFLAGIIALTDVTEYTDIIKTQSEENDQQFQLICDTMPQLVSLLIHSSYNEY